MTKEQLDFISNLFALHSSTMVRLTYFRMKDEQLAKDLVQETFLTACCKAGVVCDHEKPVAWLYDTLYKLTLREMDKAYHSAEVSLFDSGLQDSDGLHLSLEFSLPAGLDEKDRELIIWRVERSMPFAEIAARKGITEVNCRQQLSRAMRKCKELMEQELIT